LSGKRSIFRRTAKAALIFFFLLSGFQSLVADELSDEEKTLPVWVLMEKGKASFRQGDFASALTYFTFSRNKGAVLPEGEYWIGRVYDEEGELSLAILQYEKALELSRYLYVTDEKTDIVYRLAEAYLKSEKPEKYEYQLKRLIDDEVDRSVEVVEREHLYVSTLKEKGLDELLYLYRLDYNQSLRAFRELGIYYFKQGEYRSAVLYNLYAVMTFYSLGIEQLIREDPEFQFPRNREKLLEYDPLRYYDDIEKELRLVNSDFSFIREEGSRVLVNSDVQVQQALEELHEQGIPYYYSGIGYALDLFRESRALNSFMEENNIYQSLYYLACALYGEGFENRAREIWSVLDKDKKGGGWSRLATDQLKSPHIDKNTVLF
jgi:tetratricopeptide (TPR) repeat protein